MEEAIQSCAICLSDGLRWPERRLNQDLQFLDSHIPAASSSSVCGRYHHHIALNTRGSLGGSPSRLCLSDLRRSVPSKNGAWHLLACSPHRLYPLLVRPGQRFAYRLLQIPPRHEHPCCSADTSPCRMCGGLSPPSECALPCAPKERLWGCCRR